MDVPDLTPRSIGRLIDDAIALYRRNFSSLWRPVLLVVLPTAVLFAGTQVFLVRWLFENFFPAALSSSRSGPPPTMPTGMLVVYGMTGLAGLAYAASRLYFQAALYRSSGALFAGRRMETREFLAAGAHYFLPLVVLTLLAGAIQYAVYLASEVAVVVTLGIGLVLLPVVLMVTIALLSMMAPALTIEDAGVVGALRRSYALVRPNIWRVVLFLLGTWFIVGQIESAIGSPVLLRSAIDSLMHPGAVYQPLSVPWKLFEGFVQGLGLALALPIMELATLTCYLDLRSRNEGLDLLVRAQRLAPSHEPQAAGG